MHLCFAETNEINKLYIHALTHIVLFAVYINFFLPVYYTYMVDVCSLSFCVCLPVCLSLSLYIYMYIYICTTISCISLSANICFGKCDIKCSLSHLLPSCYLNGIIISPSLG